MVGEQETSIETAASTIRSARPQAEAEIIDAIHRVYHQYGRNLSAFFDDVREKGVLTQDKFSLLNRAVKHS
jgi:hypothetical protein